MAHVVLLRAANVGGKNVFRPAQFVAQLKELDVVNIGAAGTFVVRSAASLAEVRREFLKRLPFQPDLAIRPAAEVVRMVEGRPFGAQAFTKDLRGWVGVLCGPAAAKPSAPLEKPEGKAWSVRLLRVEGAYAFGLWQRQKKLLLPNRLVDAAVGVPVTVRWLETFERVVAALTAGRRINRV